MRIHESENSTMTKRPPVDLKALTSEQAAPMPEAAQRTAPLSPVGSVKTANLEALAFKVRPTSASGSGNVPLPPTSS